MQLKCLNDKKPDSVLSVIVWAVVTSWESRCAKGSAEEANSQKAVQPNAQDTTDSVS